MLFNMNQPIAWMKFYISKLDLMSRKGHELDSNAIYVLKKKKKEYSTIPQKVQRPVNFKNQST